MTAPCCWLILIRCFVTKWGEGRNTPHTHGLHGELLALPYHFVFTTWRPAAMKEVSPP